MTLTFRPVAGARRNRCSALVPIEARQYERLSLLPGDLVLIELDHPLQILVTELGEVGGDGDLVLLRRLAPSLWLHA